MSSYVSGTFRRPTCRGRLIALLTSWKDIHCVRGAENCPLQTATISEYRYQWLRVRDCSPDSRRQNRWPAVTCEQPRRSCRRTLDHCCGPFKPRRDQTRLGRLGPARELHLTEAGK